MSKTTKNSGKRLIFFGNERLATGVSTTAPTLLALVENGYDVPVVVTNFTAGKSRNARQLEIQSVAEDCGIEVLFPDKPKDIIEKLRSIYADVAVLVAYGKIVPQSIIDLFPRGIINIHPSLLPLHRGPTPIESVILSGESKTGVSIMQLAKEMDAGPVYAQSELELSGNESKQELADTLLEIGKSMIIDLLPGIIDGSVVALPQNNQHATYDGLISKQDGKIDWNKPAEQIEQEIRAYQSWPGSRTEIAGKDVIVTKASFETDDNSKLKPGEIKLDKASGMILVDTGDGAIRIERLKPAGKREMSAAEFLAGLRI